ncbi:MAG: hypothetical protein WA952_10315 [Lewinella sp.]
MANQSSALTARILHRYLGFFLAGIMAVYAISGIVLIFRNTDFLQNISTSERQIEAGLEPAAAATALNLRNDRVERTEGETVYFRGVAYDRATGVATITRKELPYVLDKMTDLHKANTNSTFFYFNIFFGLSLLFFVLTAFWMFLPSWPILRKGLIYTAAGIVLTLILLFV